MCYSCIISCLRRQYTCKNSILTNLDALARSRFASYISYRVDQSSTPSDTASMMLSLVMKMPFVLRALLIQKISSMHSRFSKKFDVSEPTPCMEWVRFLLSVIRGIQQAEAKIIYQTIFLSSFSNPLNLSFLIIKKKQLIKTTSWCARRDSNPRSQSSQPCILSS